MGKFLKYESSNYRTFIVNPTDHTVKRPNRPLTPADMLGAIIKIGDTEVIVTAVTPSESTINASLGIPDDTPGSDGGMATITYNKDTDTFQVNGVNFTNIMINEFGGEQA